ncbi:hypothetical protein HZS_4207, partial [Henneguya salminicola]
VILLARYPTHKSVEEKIRDQINKCKIEIQDLECCKNFYTNEIIVFYRYLVYYFSNNLRRLILCDKINLNLKSNEIAEKFMEIISASLSKPIFRFPKPDESCFVCPVSLDTHEDPIMSLTTGITYDKNLLETYFNV